MTDECAGREILSVKLAAPLLSRDAVPRKHLDETLWEAPYRLATIVASAGYGKSTVMSAYYFGLKERGERVAWIQLDSYDDDFGFWIYFTEAIRQIDSSQDFSWIGEFNGSRGAGVPWINALINQLSEIPFAFTLFLDDFHAISSKEVHREMQQLVLYLPSNIRIVVASREKVPFSLSRLRMQNSILEITERELAFDFQETEEYLRKSADHPVDLDEAWSVFSAAQGWIAGIKAIAVSRRRGIQVAAAVGFGERRVDNVDQLFDFFHGVLDGLEDETREFLVKSSLLFDLSASLCNYVFERSDSAEMLARFECGGLFIVRLDEYGGWYRLHPLFRSHLQEEFDARYGIETKRLSRRAVCWLEENGYVERALHYCVACEDCQRAMSLVDRLYYGRAFRSSLSPSVVSLLSGVPCDVVCRNLRCLTVFVVSLFHMGAEDTLVRLAKEMDRQEWGMGSTAPAGDGQRADELKNGKITAALVAYVRRDYRSALDMSLEALDIDAFDSYSADGLLMLLSARCCLALGEADSAIRMMEGSVENARKHEMVEEYLVAACELSRIQASLGNVRAAEGVLKAGIEYARRYSFDGAVVEYIRFSLGLVYREWGSLAMLKDLVSDERKFVASQIGDFEGWLHSPDFFLELARTCSVLGDCEQAEEYYRRAKDLLKNHLTVPFLSEQTSYARLKLWLATGESDKIEDWARAQRNRRRADSKLAANLYVVADALVFLSRNEPRLAVATLRDRLVCDDEIVLMEFRIDYHLINAWGLLCSKGPECAKPHILKALRYGACGEYVQHFADWGPWLVPLVNEVLSDASQWAEGDDAAFRVYVARVAAFLADSVSDEEDVPDWQKAALAAERARLSRREREVLRMLIEGMSTRAIAEGCGISLSTAQSHVHRIYRKLDVHDRLGAVRKGSYLVK